ncbi:hypothetical protein [Mesorhizobium sp. B1-1-8]|uniref:hypothetical protein n=1 Tax=Mesorhizobium sp. B1-1-8 TaxID=2589976 RepID=UPI00112E7492|nr:hypothetical protein [Mesorhizobium sp. B1-1-8]UCI06601.1 hypothetical protein FJ974_22740 [Mesorhizobium sp. B1-1-8]
MKLAASAPAQSWTAKELARPQDVIEQSFSKKLGSRPVAEKYISILNEILDIMNPERPGSPQETMRLLSEAARAANMGSVSEIGVGTCARGRVGRGSRLDKSTWFRVEQGGVAALRCVEQSSLTEIEVLAARKCYDSSEE